MGYRNDTGGRHMKGISLCLLALVLIFLSPISWGAELGLMIHGTL